MDLAIREWFAGCERNGDLLGFGIFGPVDWVV